MKDELVTENLGLIYSTIKSMNLSWQTKDEFQEFYDAGEIGLIKGAKAYDENLGYKPSTYLCRCIKNEIKRHLYLSSMQVRHNSNGKDISLYLPVIEDVEITLESLIKDPNINIEEDFEKKLEIERLMYAINHLKNERDKLIIKMYFGLDDYAPSTHEEIGKQLGVTRSAIQHRIKIILPILKRKIEGSKEIFILDKAKEKNYYDKERNIS